MKTASAKKRKSSVLPAVPKHPKDALKERQNGLSTISAEELDRKFDDDEDVLQYFNINQAVVEEPEVPDIAFHLPSWVLAKLEQEANRIGISIESLVKVWIVQQLDQRSSAL